MHGMNALKTGSVDIGNPVERPGNSDYQSEQ